MKKFLYLKNLIKIKNPPVWAEFEPSTLGSIDRHVTNVPPGPALYYYDIL